MTCPDCERYRVQHLRLEEVCARHEATIRSLLGENARLTEQRAKGYRAALEHLNAGKEDLPEWAERFVALALAPNPARPEVPAPGFGGVEPELPPEEPARPAAEPDDA